MHPGIFSILTSDIIFQRPGQDTDTKTVRRDKFLL